MVNRSFGIGASIFVINTTIGWTAETLLPRSCVNSSPRHFWDKSPAPAFAKSQTRTMVMETVRSRLGFPSGGQMYESLPIARGADPPSRTQHSAFERV